MQKLVDNVLVEMTDEEIAQHMQFNSDPIIVTPTKEQLLAQLQALQAQINALS